jgi:hypothetical protein
MIISVSHWKLLNARDRSSFQMRLWFSRERKMRFFLLVQKKHDSDKILFGVMRLTTGMHVT